MVPIFVCISCIHCRDIIHDNGGEKVICMYGGRIEIIDNLKYTGINNFELCPGLKGFLSFLRTSLTNEEIINYENNLINKGDINE